MPVGKALAAIAAFFELKSLDLSAHGTVDHQDPLGRHAPQCAFDVTHGYATFSSLLDEWRLRLSRASMGQSLFRKNVASHSLATQPHQRDQDDYDRQCEPFSFHGH